MRTITNIIIWLIAVLLLSSCKDDDNSTLSGDILTLKTSSDSIILLESKANEEAVTFTWNKGLDRGAENKITYIFRLDIASKNFTTSLPPEELPEGVYTKSFTHEFLNDSIIEHWGIYAGEEVDLEARIVAKVSGPVFIYPEIAYAKINVKSFAPASKPLFLIGNATSAGNDPNQAIKITESVNGKVYHWMGNMKAGGFKFITTLGSILPSLNMGNTPNSLVNRLTATDPDKMFDVPQDGTYAFVIQRKKMEITFRHVPYERVWMVGNATPAGWDIGNSVELRWVPENPNVFVYEGPLKEGEIKFPLEKNWGGKFFMAPGPDTPIDGSNENIVFSPNGDPDNKWKVSGSDAGNYRITLNINTMKINFKKL